MANVTKASCLSLKSCVSMALSGNKPIDKKMGQKDEDFMADKNESFDSGANARSQIAGGAVGAAKGAITWGLVGTVLVTALVGVLGAYAYSGLSGITFANGYLGFNWLGGVAANEAGKAVLSNVAIGAGVAAAVTSVATGFSFLVGQSLALIGGGLGFLDGAAKGNAEHGRGTLINAQQQAYDMEMNRLMGARGAEMDTRRAEAQGIIDSNNLVRQAMMAQMEAQKPKAIDAALARKNAVDMTQGADGAWAEREIQKAQSRTSDALPTMNKAESKIEAAPGTSQGVAFEVAANQMAAAQSAGARV